MATKKTATSGQKTSTIPRIVWFEIPADDPDRAKKFYAQLFGWKIEKFPAAVQEYWHIDTGGSDDVPDGGLMKRQSPEQRITNYIAVDSVDEAAAKVQKLGGTICLRKTAVPQMGYFVLCLDTEQNQFALWEKNENAK